MRRLLVVAYYTPPLGLSGVMRITKLCKFLPEAGWRPLILTVKPVAYYHYDPSLLDDLKDSRLYRTESADPNRLFNLIRSRSSRLTPALAHGLGARTRLLNHLLFPDAKVGWLPFGSVAGRHIIDREKPAAILATSPPFTSLLLGVRLKAHAHVPLVCDFRDPWPTGFTPPPAYQRAALRRLRRYLVARSELVLAANQGTAQAVSRRCAVLDNGFDPTEFEVAPTQLEGLAIVHVGNLWQNRDELFTLLSILRQRPEARLYLAGRVDRDTRSRLERNPQVRWLGALPHSQVCALMKGARALLYIGKPRQPVGLKLYEYLGARRPIIVWGQGAEEPAKLVLEAGAGLVCGLDEQRLRDALDQVQQDPERFAQDNRERFNRRCQARRLAEQLESLI
ncbi:glycosyltransferase family 4 protein [candidate division WOR-3 bacterium]|nr:glycosyltransferase family 4 protein [candidate division WOR-3 bacterium]